MSDPSYPTSLSGPSHHIIPHEGARRLVIFFGAKDLADEGYNFLQLGRELPEHRMFLNNGANEWYQYGVPGFGDSFAATLQTLKDWQAALGVDEVCTVGTSMGAYGAIQYGAALKARILAFSVDAVLQDTHSRSAEYFIGTKPPSCPDLRPLLADGTTDVTLLVGERDPVDLHAAAKLASAAPITVISLIGVDHVVPTYLKRRSRLGPLLRAFVAGNALPEQPDQGGALAAKDYVPALFAAHCAFEEGDLEHAIKHAETALAAYPYGEAAESILGQALAKQGAHSEAITWLTRSVASQHKDFKLQVVLALALRRAGAPERARQIYDQVLVQQPGYHTAHYGLGLLHLEAGRLKEAHNAFTTAQRLAAQNTNYRKRVKALAKQLRA